MTLLCLVACAALAGCRVAPEPPLNPLYVDPATHDFSDNPALLERVGEELFGGGFPTAPRKAKGADAVAMGGVRG